MSTDTQTALDKALQLASLGIHVFPLNDYKKPTLPDGYDGRFKPNGGFYHGTTDPQKVQQLWTDHPGTHVGVWAGASGLACMDVDFDPSKGIDGESSLELWNLPYGGTPLQHASPRGGMHYLYRSPETAPRPKNGIVDGVDRKTGGSYFAWRGDIPTAEQLQSLPTPPEWFCKGATSSMPSGSASAPVADEEVRAILDTLPDGPARFSIDTSAEHYGDMFEAVGDVLYFAFFDPKASGLKGQMAEIAENYQRSSATSIPEDERLRKVYDAASWWTGKWKSEEFAAGFQWAWNATAYGEADPGIPLPVPAPVAAAVAAPAEASSWHKQDLTAILNGSFKQEESKVMRRVDGPAMFYTGKVNDLHGESESGKSWIAIGAAVETMADGKRVLFMDHESDPQTVIGRMKRLGATNTQLIELLDYRRPQEWSASEDNQTDLLAYESAVNAKADLVVIDGVTEAMGVMGKNPMDNEDVRAWWNFYPRLLARNTGAAVVLIDHVTKSGEGRGRFAFGAQHKMSAIDGASYYVDVEDTLGPGKLGTLKVYVAKDRPGGVRQHAGVADKSRKALFGIFELDSRDSVMSYFQLLPWTDSKQLAKMAQASMEQTAHIVKALKDAGGTIKSQKKLIEALKENGWENATEVNVPIVLKGLEEDGTVRITQPSNGGAKTIALVEA